MYSFAIFLRRTSQYFYSISSKQVQRNLEEKRYEIGNSNLQYRSIKYQFKHNINVTSSWRHPKCVSITLLLLKLYVWPTKHPSTEVQTCISGPHSVHLHLTRGRVTLKLCPKDILLKAVLDSGLGEIFFVPRGKVSLLRKLFLICYNKYFQKTNTKIPKQLM